MNKELLVKYANLIVRTGANLQKGQEVVIDCSIEAYDFIKILVEEFYKEGAKKVRIKWGDPALTTIKYKYEDEDTLSNLTSYQKEEYEYDIKNLPVKVFITSDAPDALKDVDVKKLIDVMKVLRPKIRFYRDQMEDEYQWIIAAYPSYDWAEQVYPGLDREEAFEKLLEAILQVSRVDDKNDPNKNWEVHDGNLTCRSELLNNMKLVKLTYKSKNGTDFCVGLNPDVRWEGGGMYTKKTHVYFNPNIPSEEVFTSPIRGKAEGIVYSSKPLSYNGNLIEDFSVRFENGKAVEVHAKTNEDILKSIIDTDENSAYLGECALIGYTSPISQLNTVFYETLFDENASCHLAFGMGFQSLYPDYDKYSVDELFEKGINKSATHVDFMIGTSDMSIIGTDINGVEHVLFHEGERVF